MTAFITSPWFSLVITWIAPVVLIAIGIAAAIAYYRPISEARRMRTYMILVVAAVAFRLAFAVAKTGLQYFAWTLSDVSRLLLPPHQSISVLLRFGWAHFGLNALVSIGAAILFFIVLRALRSYNPRYFEVGEVELGFLMALVVGWPNFIIFVPVVFLLVIVISIIRGIFLREPYTTLGLPFFLGGAIAYAATPYLMTVIDLAKFAI